MSRYTHRPALDPEILYLGDNGRCHCGAAACAGVTAYTTGRGLDGDPCVPVTIAEVLGWRAMYPSEDLACETCGRTATDVPGPTGAVITRAAAPVPVPCPACNGRGRGGPNTTDGGPDDDCAACSGEGVT